MTLPPDEVSPGDGLSARRLTGRARAIVRAGTLGLAVYALYWVLAVVQPQIYRTSFLLVALVLVFLQYPPRRGSAGRVPWTDWLAAAAAVIALGWPIIDFDRFVYRAATPLAIDLALGAVAILLVLEAARRTVGWILPLTAGLFLVYAYAGPVLDLAGLGIVAHRGYGLDRLIGTLYMTLEGVFGVPLDVAATYIILFTLYGAVLEASGAGRFFLDWSLAALGRSGGGAAPGRTVVLSGVLLGTVSGSGVANTVTLGAVAWPMLRQAGYPAEVGGGILSAAGIGAILCPPALGAAAFIIAEFLKISYLDVVVMAIVPALLYFLSIFLMIEADSRRLHTRYAPVQGLSLGGLMRAGGHHFLSVAAMVTFLVTGVTAFRAVFWAMLVAIGLSFVGRGDALGPRRLARAFERGARDILGVVATTATAGIIVGVVTLTGLGLKLAGVIVALAAGRLWLTVVYAAISVWVLGLAVPVTASYVIAAVMVAPALVEVGVPAPAAHMFIFYYAVLSEVSPPTALSPFAAAALTGGRPFRTLMMAWKYTIPAFLVPFAFTLDAAGLGLLLQAPWADVARVTLTAGMGIGSLAAGLGGWLRGPASPLERVAWTAAGLLLFVPSAAAQLAGLGVFAAVAGLHLGRRRWKVGGPG